MKEILNFLNKRLREPSTYAAISSIAVALHMNIDEEVYKGIIDGLIGVTGVLGIFLKEKGA